MSLPGAAGLLTAGFDTYRDARNSACFVYRNDLYGVLSRYLASQGVTALTPQALADIYLFNGMMNDFCRDSPSPAQLFETPYSGGQCLTSYRVVTAWSARFISNGVINSGGGEFIMPGALGAIQEFDIDPGQQEFWGIRIANGLGTNTPGFSQITTAYNKALWDSFTFQLISVQRVDNQPDNCGDPAPFPIYNYYDPGSAPPPPPVRLPPPGNGPPPEVDVDVNFNFDGSITVGGGNFRIDFSPSVDNSGGLFFNPSYTGGGFNAPSGSYTPPPAGEPGGAASTERVETVINNTERIETNTERIEEKLKPCCPPLAECTTVILGSAQSRVVTVNGEIAYVSLNLVTIPSNVRTQAGVSAPDVYYSGWYSFGSGGSAGVRNAVHFEQNFYPAPCGCDSFSYTLYEGFEGSLTVYVKPVQNETQ